jgi:polyisoprenyl-phosphate glycosyltransferase
MDSSPASITFCIPIFNDWETARLLLAQLDAALAGCDWTVKVMFVDDGSTQAPIQLAERMSSIAKVEMLCLRRNVGHQRAIALGLTYLYAESPCSAAVVMDGDGEDAATDAIKLIRAWQETDGSPVVFARRSRRSESLAFRIGYQAYKLVHYLLTGRAVEVGNFSVVPYPALARLVAVSELWNHYAAAVYKARLRVLTVPIPRASRLAGRSSMNFTSLVIHGLSAVSVFGDQIGVRLLFGNVLLMIVVTSLLVTVAGVKVFSAWAIPGWATSAAGLLLTLLLINFLLSMVFVFIVLQGRSGTSFLPLRDYKYFIIKPITLFAQSTEPSQAKDD